MEPEMMHTRNRSFAPNQYKPKTHPKAVVLLLALAVILSLVRGAWAADIQMQNVYLTFQPESANAVIQKIHIDIGHQFVKQYTHLEPNQRIYLGKFHRGQDVLAISLICPRMVRKCLVYYWDNTCKRYAEGAKCQENIYPITKTYSRFDDEKAWTEETLFKVLPLDIIIKEKDIIFKD